MNFQPGQDLAQDGAVELGEVALGRVGVGGEGRIDPQRRADPHLVLAGEVGLLEVELADAAGRLELGGDATAPWA